MDFKLKPKEDRVIILPDPVEKITKGGIIIPDTAEEKPEFGTVVAVGPGVSMADETLIKLEKILAKLEGRDPEIVQPLKTYVGEHVMYGKHAGVPIEFEGTKYLIMRESDITLSTE